MAVGRWQDHLDQWKATQRDLAARMVVAPLDPLPRFVAGADCAFSADKTTAFAAAVVYDRVERRVIEIAHAAEPVGAPYVPGFLSFREGPAVLSALGKLTHDYGVVCFDGQGYAHPRRCGLAVHMAVTLGVPGVGVAKSRFIGTYADLPAAAGSAVPLMDKAEQIGVVLRTRAGVNPLFVSVGHRVDLPSAAALVLDCCRVRVPEPTRQADAEVARLKKRVTTETRRHGEEPTETNE